MSLTRTGAVAVERFAMVAARSVMAPLLTPFPVGLFWRRTRPRDSPERSRDRDGA